MSNKTGSRNQNSTKFAAVVPVDLGMEFAKFCNNRININKVTIKKRWTQVRGPENGCRQSLI
jgi:hypothetical protein